MNIAAFVSFMLSSSFSPGPNNIISMTNGSRYGIKRALPYSAGVFTGVCLLASLAAFFGAALYAAIPAAEPVMRVVGSLYILYLAWTLLRDKPKSGKKHRLDTTKYVSGVLLQFVNVKAYLYALTSMTSFVLPYFRGAAVLPFVLLLAAISFVSNIVWAIFGLSFDRFFKNHKKAINIVMALLLVYCALSMLAELWR